LPVAEPEINRQPCSAPQKVGLGAAIPGEKPGKFPYLLSKLSYSFHDSINCCQKVIFPFIFCVRKTDSPQDGMMQKARCALLSRPTALKKDYPSFLGTLSSTAVRYPASEGVGLKIGENIFFQ
jgi:hypothetical protein